MVERGKEGVPAPLCVREGRGGGGEERRTEKKERVVERGKGGVPAPLCVREGRGGGGEERRTEKKRVVERKGRGTGAALCPRGETIKCARISSNITTIKLIKTPLFSAIGCHTL